jgi:hypothetical protein
MEPADVLTPARYSLCTISDEATNKVIAIRHADDLADFLPTINGGGFFMVIDRSPDARIADQLAQYVPVLDAYAIARFRYTRIEFVTGVDRGNGRRAGGQYTANHRYSHANPFTVESLDHAIETFHRFHAEKLAQLSAAQ